MWHLYCEVLVKVLNRKHTRSKRADANIVQQHWDTELTTYLQSLESIALITPLHTTHFSEPY